MTPRAKVLLAVALVAFAACHAAAAYMMDTAAARPAVQMVALERD
jgi:hypothetical protein